MAVTNVLLTLRAYDNCALFWQHVVGDEEVRGTVRRFEMKGASCYNIVEEAFAICRPVSACLDGAASATQQCELVWQPSQTALNPAFLAPANG